MMLPPKRVRANPSKFNFLIVNSIDPPQPPPPPRYIWAYLIHSYTVYKHAYFIYMYHFCTNRSCVFNSCILTMIKSIAIISLIFIFSFKKYTQIPSF